MATAVQTEMFCALNDLDQAAGTLSTEVDWVRCILRVKGAGFWTMRQAKEHGDRFNACIDAIHGRGQGAIVIGDLRYAAPQSQDVADYIQSQNIARYTSKDRVALIVANSLVKVQMRRIQGQGRCPHEFFLSVHAAENWALAYVR